MLWTVGMSVGLAGKASLLHWDPDKVLHASTEDHRYRVSLLLRYSSCSGTPCVGMEVAFSVLQGEAGGRALGLHPSFRGPLSFEFPGLRRDVLLVLPLSPPRPPSWAGVTLQAYYLPGSPFVLTLRHL